MMLAIMRIEAAAVSVIRWHFATKQIKKIITCTDKKSQRALAKSEI